MSILLPAKFQGTILATFYKPLHPQRCGVILSQRWLYSDSITLLWNPEIKSGHICSSAGTKTKHQLPLSATISLKEKTNGRAHTSKLGLFRMVGIESRLKTPSVTRGKLYPVKWAEVKGVICSAAFHLHLYLIRYMKALKTCSFTSSWIPSVFKLRCSSTVLSFPSEVELCC